MKIKFPAILLLLLLMVFIPIIMADSDVQSDNISSSSATRKIAFVSKRDGNSEIYTINDNGSGLIRLTDNKVEDIMPQWSSDGTKILYISVNGGRREIWVMNSDGSNSIRLAEDCDPTYPPSWSPDGSKILFALKPSLRQNSIYTVDANGENLICVTDGESRGTFASWSPDGAKILYVQEYQKEAYIFSMNSDGTNRVKLTRDEGTYTVPTWSPDGKKIAYIFTKKSILSVEPMIYVMNADGSGQLGITKGDYDIQWSPDGTMIAFTKVGDRIINYRPGYQPEIIKIYGLFLISTDGNGHDTKVALMGEERSFPGWAPNSSKVMYMCDSKLNIYNIRNRNITKVKISTPLSVPKVSPDGTKILWEGGKAGVFKKSYLFIAKSDGATVTKLTNSGTDSDPVWGPVVNQ
jgi:Tol biopolymer transport system component